MSEMSSDKTYLTTEEVRKDLAETYLAYEESRLYVNEDRVEEDVLMTCEEYEAVLKAYRQFFMR